MNILAVDATGEILSVAIGKVSLSKAAKKHDEALLPLVEKAMKKAKLRWEDLDAIAAASGPGRFTGIRIGMSFAVAAASKLEIPALAVSRLEAAAEKHGGAKVLAALPGWKDEVYHQAFVGGKGAPPAWSSPADWPAARDAAEKKGLAIAYGETGAADLLAPAERQLASKKRPPFAPFYLKPAGYERARS